MQHLHSILLVAGLALAVPAPMTTKTPSTAVAPATTPAPSPSSGDSGNTGGGVIYPSYTFGSTVINGQTYPIVGGGLGGGGHFTGSGYSITGAAGGYLYNCYAMINNQVSPALCYGGSEEDTEVFVYGGQTFYDGGLPGYQSDAAFSGKFPGPQSFSLAGAVGNPGGAIFGGAATGLYTPALNPGNTANGGAGGDGTVTLGPISAGGLVGGSFVTQPSYTSYGGGAGGSAGIGPLNGAATLGGHVVGTTQVGCGGGNVEGVGYTACVTNPF